MSRLRLMFNETESADIETYRTQRLAMANSTNSSRNVSQGVKLLKREKDPLYIKIIMRLKRSEPFSQRKRVAAFFDGDIGRLWFEKEPNVYYEAIQDGEMSFDFHDGYSIAEVTMLIPDGLAHSIQSDIYTTQSDTFTVNNKGTYKSYPILEATMPGDNGVVAFINHRGKILQFGNPDEADGVGYTESDRVIWDTVMIASAEASRGWKTNGYQFDGLWNGTEKLNANGTRKFGSDGGYGFVTPDSYGTGTQGFLSLIHI